MQRVARYCQRQLSYLVELLEGSQRNVKYSGCELRWNYKIYIYIYIYIYMCVCVCVKKPSFYNNV